MNSKLEFNERSTFTLDEIDENGYPFIRNMSAAFFYTFLPSLEGDDSIPEYAFVNPISFAEKTFIAEWNMAWEAGSLRSEFFEQRESNIPDSFRWLENLKDKNAYLVHNISDSIYDTYAPLYHLLPLNYLKRYQLPLLKDGFWPNSIFSPMLGVKAENFNDNFNKAFSTYIWSFLNKQLGNKPQSDFSHNDPIVILSHNMDFWLPYAYKASEEKLKSFGRVDIEDTSQLLTLNEINQGFEKEGDGIIANRPYKGGYLWSGKEEAEAITEQILLLANERSDLFNIIDRIKSDRVDDDFPRWSKAKEDFERALYKKRSKKFKVTLVELKDDIAIHSPHSQLFEDELCEDFIAILNEKERKIVLLLRSGITKQKEISEILGYSNHSPVNKKLAKIRKQLKCYLESRGLL